MRKLLLTLCLLITTISPAYADCVYKGETYPTGTRIGGFVCQPDGTWKPAK